jgi:hypothetical protein
LYQRFDLNVDYEHFKSLFEKYCDDNYEISVVDDYIVALEPSDALRLGKVRTTNSSGFIGVYFNKRTGKFYWQMSINGKKINRYGFKTAEDGAADRDEFIRTNRLSARLSDGSKYLGRVIFKVNIKEIKPGFYSKA